MVLWDGIKDHSVCEIVPMAWCVLSHKLMHCNEHCKMWPHVIPHDLVIYYTVEIYYRLFTVPYFRKIV